MGDGKLPARIGYAVMGATPMLVATVTLIMVWAAPLKVEGGNWVRAGAVIMVVEFILLHSGAFMSLGPLILKKWWQRALYFTGFALVYFVGLYLLARWVRSPSFMMLVIGVLVSRLLSLVILSDKKAVILMLTRSSVGIFVFMFTVWIIFLPLPRWGLSEEIALELIGRRGDMVSEHPERMIAWGIVYFALMAAAEAMAGWGMPDWTQEHVEEAWKKLGRGE